MHIDHSLTDSLSAVAIFGIAAPVRTMEPSISPLMLSDHLITLAVDADRAGFPDAATTLISLAHTVLDEHRLQ